MNNIKNFKSYNKKSKGFTLIEIIIVMVILGFLLGQMINLLGESVSVSEINKKYKDDFNEFKARLSSAMFGQQTLFNLNNPDNLMVNLSEADMNDLIKGTFGANVLKPLRDINGRFYVIKQLTTANNVIENNCVKEDALSTKVPCSNLNVIRFYTLGQNGKDDYNPASTDIAQGDDIYEDINLKIDYSKYLESINDNHKLLLNMIVGVAESARSKFINETVTNTYGEPLSEKRVAYSYAQNALHYDDPHHYSNNKAFLDNISSLITSNPSPSSMKKATMNLGDESKIGGIKTEQLLMSLRPHSIPKDAGSGSLTSTGIVLDNYIGIPFSRDSDGKINYKVYNLKI
jgi:prepilin-type N-terminal cleavage/methylation domain-containing protein